jgi:hypothetical protein
MLKFLRAEAAIDGRITKLLQRIAGLKAFKQLHGLPADLGEVAEDNAPPTQLGPAPKLERSVPAKR